VTIKVASTLAAVDTREAFDKFRATVRALRPPLIV
jgi:hypothetical protein